MTKQERLTRATQIVQQVVEIVQTEMKEALCQKDFFEYWRGIYAHGTDLLSLVRLTLDLGKVHGAK